MRDKVLRVIEELRPFLHADGGDIELVDVDEVRGQVMLHMTGACNGCPAQHHTIEHAIKVRLQEAIPTIREVIAV